MSTLTLRANVSIWFFMLKLFPLQVSIDGAPPAKATWGDNPYQLAAGQHTVSVQWLMYWFLPVNKAELVVDVPAGAGVTVEYKYRYFFFMPGKISVAAA